MASSLSPSLSSMEAMLDALMQRGVGAGDDRPKDDAPPALPTRPTARGRLPSSQRAGALAGAGAGRPWSRHQSPTPKEDEEAKCAVNLDLERRALKAEEEMKQKDGEIAALKEELEHYKVRCSDCELKIKSMEEKLQKQTASLQTNQNPTTRTNEPPDRRREPQAKRPDETSARQQQQQQHARDAAVDERQSAVSHLAKEFRQQSQAFENNARMLVEPRPGQLGLSARAVDDFKILTSQFRAWKKEYKARLRRTKAELYPRRSWWRTKAFKCIKCPNPASCLKGFKCPNPCSCCCCCL